MTDGFTVAIDGPAAAGKGTISKAVAAHFGFAHLDTGLLYRAVGAKVLTGVTPEQAALDLLPHDLEGDSLRTPQVAHFARRAGGAVLDGRDIGTVICPDAQVKMFVTASAAVRAERRFLELSGKGMNVTRETVLADVQARDARDMGRADAPLKPAADAVMVDTSDLAIEDAISAAIAVIDGAYAAGS